MRKISIYIYMMIIHPVLFFNYTMRKKSRFFLANGRHQHIQIKSLAVGSSVRIGDYTRINFYDVGKLIIGNGCYIGQRNSFLVGADIIINEGVLMASDICITSENHAINPESSDGYGTQSLLTAPVEIGEGCWIGEKVIILPGVSIGKKSIVGAGSIVTKDIPEYSIAVGNPAKVIKRYNFNNKEWENVFKI